VNSVAITGASGYVGSHLAAYFLKRGWRVIGLSHRPSGIPGCEHVPFSLTQAPPDLTAQRVDVLIHAAYDFRPVTWSDIDAVNVNGTRKLLSMTRKVGIPRMILISSLSAFRGTTSLYGKAKLATEDLILTQGGCAIRSGLIYGGNGGTMMKTFEQMASAHKYAPVLSHGSSKIYTVHIEDLSELVFQISSIPSWPPAEPIYIAAHRTGWTIQSIMQTFARRAGHSITLIPIAWPFVWGALRLLELFGLRPRFRSDSVLSLVHPNPDITRHDFYWPGLSFRGLDAT
jgi:nucleoside-diphosphate-sugar epimerase